MKAIVTGACGFVGGYLARHLQSCGDEVIGTVFQGPEKSKYSYETVELNVADPEQCAQVIRRIRPEVVYHLAGIAFVPEAENDFQRTLSINVGGTNNIYRVAHMLDCGMTVVLVSSAEIYGRMAAADLPMTEDSPVRPANNYSLSKAMAELTAERYAQFKTVKSVVLRPFNHIGPGQDVRFVASNFAQQLAQIAKGKAEPVLRVGNLEAKRDFSDVRDFVRAYRLAAVKGEGIYVVSSGRSYSIQSLLDELVAISGLDVKIEPDPLRMRPSEVPEVRGSYAKLERELGWKPEIELRETLGAIYRSFLEQA